MVKLAHNWQLSFRLKMRKICLRCGAVQTVRNIRSHCPGVAENNRIMGALRDVKEKVRA